MGAGELGGSVGRPVVDDEDLGRDVPQPLQARTEPRRLVTRGDDDRDRLRRRGGTAGQRRTAPAAAGEAGGEDRGGGGLRGEERAPAGLAESGDRRSLPLARTVRRYSSSRSVSSAASRSSLDSERDSIWRMRSRETLKRRDTSVAVQGSSPHRP